MRSSYRLIVECLLMLFFFINCFAQPRDRNKTISLYNDTYSTKSISRNSYEDSTLSELTINAEKPKRDTSKVVIAETFFVVDNSIKLFTERGFKEIAAINSTGIIQDARRGELNIRGGRAEETGYYIDGVEINDPLTGRLSTTLSPRSIIEVGIMKSDFGAQYGNAMSGIVNVITKSGMPNYFGSLEYVTDEFLGDGFKGLRSTGSSLWSLTLGGPIIPKYRNLLQFFGTFEYQFDRDPNPSYNSEQLRNIANTIWPKFREFSVNYIRALQGLPNVEGDEIINESKRFLIHEPSWNKYRPGQLPNSSQRKFVWNEKITLNVGDFRLVLGGFSSRTDYYTPLSSYLLMNAFHNPYTLSNNDLYNLKATWYSIAKTLIEGQVSYFRLHTETMDPLHRDRLFDYGDPYKNPLYKHYARSPFDERYGVRIPKDKYLNFFPFPGQIFDSFFKQNTSFWRYNADVKQVFANHTIKFGGEYRIYKLRQYSISPSGLWFVPTDLKQIILSNPDLLDSTQREDVFRMYRFLGVDTYGYDYFGREFNSNGYDKVMRREGPKTPFYAAMYIHERFELEGCIINAGIRWDRWDTNTDFFKDLNDITNSKNTQLWKTPENFRQKSPGLTMPVDGWGDPNTIEDDSFKKVEPISSFSPRVSISLPVSEKTILFAQYGTFVQVPVLQHMLMSTEKLQRPGYFDNYVSIKNPSLNFPKTIQYEIGGQFQVSDYIDFYSTIYYKLVTGLIRLEFIQSVFNKSVFSTIQNRDNSKIKGFELSISLKRWNNWSANLNYTLSSSNGTGSDVYTYASFLWVNIPVPTYEYPLDFDQRHTISANIVYRFEDLGNNIFKNTGINLLFRANSGRPYTLGNPLSFPATTITKPSPSLDPMYTGWNYRFDLRIDKTFNLPLGLRLNTYVLCFNVFNHRDIVSVRPSSGKPDNTGYLGTPEAKEVIDRLIETGRESEVPVYTGLYNMFEMEQANVGAPRQIRFGFVVEF